LRKTVKKSSLPGHLPEGVEENCKKSSLPGHLPEEVEENCKKILTTQTFA
jgi:hypothetical protein